MRRNRLRVPRLRQPVREVAAGEVPVELLRLDAPAWWSRESALDWIDTEGISTEVLDSQSAASAERMEWGPLNRHRFCAEVWSLSKGWSKPWCAANPRLVPDVVRLRDAGVPLSVPGGYLRERFTHAGVRFEGGE